MSDTAPAEVLVRRVLIYGVAGLAALFGVVAGLLAWTFSGGGPVEDGRVLPGGAIVVKDGYTTAFLVPLDDGKVALVDAGNDADGKAIHAALTKVGKTEDDVAAVMLTHGHPDHTAACGRFPNAKVYAGQPELPVLAGTAKTRGPLPSLFGASKSSCRDPIGVADRQVVDLDGKEAHAYSMPGHTAGSTAWRIDGVVYLGDSGDATADGRLLGAKWLFSDDVALSQRSLVALADALSSEQAQVELLACAHTGVLPYEALETFAEANR